MALLSSALLLRTHSLSLLTIAFYLILSPSLLLTATPIWLLGESMSIRPAAFAHDQDQLLSAPSAATILTGARQRNAPSAAAGGFRPPALGGAAGLGRSAATTVGGTGSATPLAEAELLALLALVVAVYALLQLVFAGDLTLLPSAAHTTYKASKTQPSSAATSSRYAEELHTLLTAQSRWLTISGLRILGSSVLVFWLYAFHSHSSAFTSTSAATTTGFSLLANRVIFTLGLTDMLFWGYLWTVLKDEGREVAKNIARRREAEDDE